MEPLLCIAVPSVRAVLCPWQHPAGTVVGVALVVLGRVVTFTSVLQLRRRRRQGGACATGWFRWSRNPGLCGMFLLYAGLAAMFGAPLLWCGAPVYFANMHRRVRLEEAHLAAAAGSAWPEYALRVPRYLPLPGLR
jgi:protein-S-isoprenylcysteine O-methyltransferase Ste14